MARVLLCNSDFIFVWAASPHICCWESDIFSYYFKCSLYCLDAFVNQFTTYFWLVFELNLRGIYFLMSMQFVQLTHDYIMDCWWMPWKGTFSLETPLETVFCNSASKNDIKGRMSLIVIGMMFHLWIRVWPHEWVHQKCLFSCHPSSLTCHSFTNRSTRIKGFRTKSRN